MWLTWETNYVGTRNKIHSTDWYYATDKTAIDDQVCFPDSQLLAQTNVQ